jgi:hypothetical protein
MGNISQYSSGIWCYKSSGFKTSASLINYFDKYNVFAGKYVDYLKFRKVYIMITEGKHLNNEGVKKIRRISKSMVQLKSSCDIFSFPMAEALAFFVVFFFYCFFMPRVTDIWFVLLSSPATDPCILATTEIDINYQLLLSPLVG